MMIRTKRVILNSKDFFDVYAISMLYPVAEDFDKEYLAQRLQPIAEKYRDLTLFAVRAELRYFLTQYGEDEGSIENKALLENLGVSNWRHSTRKSLPIESVITLFDKGFWECDFGGEAWGDIAVGCKNLMSVLPVTANNVQKVILAIDHLNDLEHNNSLYLKQYSTFNFLRGLDIKAVCDPFELFAHCSQEFRKMSREYSGKLKWN